MTTRRSGCSGCLGLLLLASLAVAIYLWPAFVDTKGVETAGALVEKQETVRISYTEWFRRLQIVATYRIPGQPLEHRATCDVDQPTYDSLHIGNPVTVHYIPTLLTQPFVSATHLSPCTSSAAIGINPVLMHRLTLALATLLLILVLWKILRLRIAAWLLLPWFVIVAAIIVLPRAEPAPQQPHSTKATVHQVVTIKDLLADGRSIPLSRPYQIISLEYTPDGMDRPVVAVDKIDLNSIPDLQENQLLDIDYDAANPRIARLRAGTRTFPEHAVGMVLVLCAVFLVLFLIFFAIRTAWHIFFGQPLERAARIGAMLRRKRF